MVRRCWYGVLLKQKLEVDVAVIDRAAQAIDSVQPLSHLQLQQHHVYLVRVFKL